MIGWLQWLLSKDWAEAPSVNLTLSEVMGQLDPGSTEERIERGRRAA